MNDSQPVLCPECGAEMEHEIIEWFNDELRSAWTCPTDGCAYGE